MQQDHYDTHYWKFYQEDVEERIGDERLRAGDTLISEANPNFDKPTASTASYS